MGRSVRVCPPDRRRLVALGRGRATQRRVGHRGQAIHRPEVARKDPATHPAGAAPQDSASQAEAAPTIRVAGLRREASRPQAAPVGFASRPRPVGLTPAGLAGWALEGRAGWAPKASRWRASRAVVARAGWSLAAPIFDGHGQLGARLEVQPGLVTGEGVYAVGLLVDRHDHLGRHRRGALLLPEEGELFRHGRL